MRAGAALLPLALLGGWGRAPRRAPEPAPAGVEFTNVTEGSGVRFRHENSPTTSKYLIETMGGGVAVFDYDNDGWLDIFFVNGAELTDPMPPGASPTKASPRFANRMYHNNHDGTFTDVTERAGLAGTHGYGMGVAVGDYDNDGFEDLYVTNFGSNVLYHNNGDGTFTDVTERAGVAGGGWSTSAAFLDYNNDGLLDLFVCRYVDWSFENNPYCGEHRPGYREYCHPRNFKGMTNLLFKNKGDGTFRDVSAEAGISKLVGKSLGVAIADYDNDGFVDIFVANDSVPGFLLRNDGKGKFVDVALAAGGIAEATLSFSGWGTRFLDYDNDGHQDLFVAQGHVLDTIELTSDHLRYQQPPLLLKGDGDRFRSVGPVAGAAFRRSWAGRGAAFGDLDNDGDTDIVVANCGERPYILRNDGGNRLNWLSLRMVGTRSNRDGIGCRVKTVTTSGLTQYHTVSTASSYLSASDKRLLIGLGSAEGLRRVEIRWPSGIVQTLDDLKANQTLTVREPPR